ncbi:MAG: hypothetical protein QHH75_13605 [Bacillota bacterium]|nr:hypothetical protein [Bacillota bacterium]
MAFEVYQPRGERKSKLPIVSLSKNSLVMNKQAREQLKAEDSIELAYDRDANVIRIRASEDGLAIKKTKVFAKGFYNYFGITKTGKFVARYDENENALYVDLKQNLL